MRRRLPPLLFFGCLGTAALFQSLLPIPLGWYSFEKGMAVGAVVLLVSGLIAGLALREMSRAGTAIEPMGRPSHLVTSGPFRFTRNPLYVALVLVMLAIGVMAQSVWFAAAALVLLLLLDRLVVRSEEIVVGDVFGADYTAYRTRVHRWV